MRVDCTGEVRQPRQPGIGKFRSSRPNPVHMRRGEWADAAPVSGIKMRRSREILSRDEFPVGGKFDSAMAAATTGVKVYEWVLVIFGYYKEGGAK